MIKVNSGEQTVGEIGELALLDVILAELKTPDCATVANGDDAAVLRHSGDTVITTDTMIEGPDFRLDWHTGFELGQKLAATNLADVAAMGATPTALTVAIACPPETRVEFLRQIARGLTHACNLLAPGTAVVGGDLATAKQLVCAVTALGEMRGRKPVTRSGARPGMVIAYAGLLGLSGYGLQLLVEHGRQEAERLCPQALREHLTPSAAVSAGVTAAEAGAAAMLDVSDGLVLDAGRIARASGVRVSLSSEQLQRVNARRVDPPGPPLDSLLYGGEDHGMLVCFEAASVPPEFTVIGRIIAGRPAVLLDGEELSERGWDPFKNKGNRSLQVR